MAPAERQAREADTVQAVSLVTGEEDRERIGNVLEDAPPFVFVSMNGKRKQQDQGQRRLIRTHVMRNYLDHAGDASKHVPRADTAVQGQKLRFRLRGEKLEASIPSRPKGRAAAIHRAKGEPSRSDPAAKFINTFASKKSPLQTLKKVENPSQEKRGHQLSALGDEIPECWPVGSSPVWELEEALHAFPPEPLASEGWYPNFDSSVLATSPLVSFGKGQLDPFETFPVGPISRATETWIDQFHNGYDAKSWCPVNPHGGWFKSAMTDPLLFHGTIFSFAMMNMKDDRIRLVESPEVGAHKLLAIQLVNERLLDPVACISDETIGAVVCLAHIESSFGNIEASRAHMAGLLRMVSLRGGLGSLAGAISGLLQRLVGWTDVVHAETVHSPLMFEGNVPLLVEKEGYDRAKSAIKLELRSPWQPISEQVITIFHEIRHLCDEYNGKPQEMFSEAEKVHLSDSLWPVERRALTLAYQTDHSVEAIGIGSFMSEACSLAGLIFVHAELRDLPVSYRIFDEPVARLQEALAMADDLLLTWTFAPELLMWALVTGAVVSAKRPQRHWFIESLAIVTQGFVIPDWVGLKGVLRTFLYVETVDEWRYVEVWEEVEMLQHGNQHFE